MITQLLVGSLLLCLAELNGSWATTLCVPPMLLLPWPEPIPSEIQWKYKNQLQPVKDTLSIVRSWNETEAAIRLKQKRLEQAFAGKLIDAELFKSMIDLKKLSIMCNALTKFSKAKALTEQAIHIANSAQEPAKDFNRLLSGLSSKDSNAERIICDFLGHLDSPADVLESLFELMVPDAGSSPTAKRDHDAISNLIGQLMKGEKPAIRRR